MAGNVDWVNTVVQEYRQISVTDTAKKLDVSCGSAYSIIHEDFRYNKICVRWVQKQLEDEYKKACVEVCMQFLQQYHEEWEAFLQQIVTGDET